MPTQAEYEAEKARLKALREEARQRLRQARKGSAADYSAAVQRYVDAQQALKDFYLQHLGPTPTRAQRRCAALRAKGIVPVWER